MCVVNRRILKINIFLKCIFKKKNKTAAMKILGQVCKKNGSPIANATFKLMLLLYQPHHTLRQRVNKCLESTFQIDKQTARKKKNK